MRSRSKLPQHGQVVKVTKVVSGSRVEISGHLSKFSYSLGYPPIEHKFVIKESGQLLSESEWESDKA